MRTCVTCAALWVGLSLLSPAVRAETQPPSPEKLLMELEGIIYPQRFLEVPGEPFGHHAMVWKEGRTANRALIVAETPDRAVAERLAALGATGGNNLSPAAWENRRDLSDPSADARVRGSTVEVWVEWRGGGGPQRLADLIGLPDAVYRFGDHRALIPIWRSGCIVCNVSCPGGKISNQTLTLRDQTEGRLHPKLNLKDLPPDGTRVRVRLYRAGW